MFLKKEGWLTRPLVVLGILWVHNLRKKDAYKVYVDIRDYGKETLCWLLAQMGEGFKPLVPSPWIHLWSEHFQGLVLNSCFTNIVTWTKLSSIYFNKLNHQTFGLVTMVWKYIQVIVSLIWPFNAQGSFLWQVKPCGVGQNKMPLALNGLISHSLRCQAQE